MPFIKINGKLIAPNSNSSPVEVVAESVKCNSSGVINNTDNYKEIFFGSNNKGRIEIKGVNDSGYKLVTPDSNTIIALFKQDAFKGKLKINNVSSCYCKKGLAPLGDSIATYSAGTYSLVRNKDGYCVVKDSKGKDLNILSTAEENKKTYTFVLCGGGAGGGAGTSGWGATGGFGGGGGAGLIATISFADVTEDITLELKVGSGGGGGSGSNGAGSSGGKTYISKGSTEILTANGGSAGPRANTAGGSNSNGGSGGSASVASNSPLPILKYSTVSGGKGAKEKDGGGTTKVETYNYTINNNWEHRKTMGGYNGNRNGGGGQVGGGGASPFSNTSSCGHGVGGNGGEGNFFCESAGSSGVGGFIEIIY